MSVSKDTKIIPCEICGAPVEVSKYTWRTYCDKCREEKYKNRPDLRASYKYRHSEKGKETKRRDEKRNKHRFEKYYKSEKGWKKRIEQRRRYNAEKRKKLYQDRYKRQKEVLDIIDDMLKEKSKREHVFYDLVDPITGKHPRVDGYYEKHKLIVEVHGIQHYIPTQFSKKMSFWEALINTYTYKRRDFIKQEYCIDKNLNFIVVPYAIPIKDVPALVEDQIKNKWSRIVRVGKWFRFSYGHRLESPYLDDFENYVVFGKCNNLFGHGHNAKLYVEVKGFVDPLTGMVINFVDLDWIVSRVINKFDHQNLNTIDKYGNMTTTSENTLRVLWELLKPELPILNRLVFYETENSVSELRKEDMLR